MPTKDLIDKYVNEICPTCINKNCSLCNITIHADNKTREARCDYYEKTKK